MQQPFKSLPAWLKRRTLISLVAIIPLVTGVGLYWHLSNGREIEKSKVGGRENAGTCSQRLNQ